MDVWTYWEGPKPQFIDVCLRSLQRVCKRSKFHLLTPENVHQYIDLGKLVPEYINLPEKHPSIAANLGPTLRANVIRAALLAEYGGLWCDADTVGLQDPSLLLENYPNASVIYAEWSNPPIRVLNGYIYCEKESGAAREWLSRVDRKLALDAPGAVNWAGLGEKVLTHFIPDWPRSVKVPLNVFLPIEIDNNVDKFFCPGDFWDYLEESSLLFGLNFSWFMYHKKAEMTLPLREWHKSPLLIHQLLIYCHNLNNGR